MARTGRRRERKPFQVRIKRVGTDRRASCLAIRRSGSAGHGPPRGHPRGGRPRAARTAEGPDRARPWPSHIGYEGQVRPRSGLAAKHGVTVVNTPGTVDSDYRGEVAVVLVNLGTEPVTIAPLDRIAQIVFARHEIATLVRGLGPRRHRARRGGYGSTGG